MNKVVLSGKMVREADYRMTNGGMSVARFTLAVDSKTKDKDTGKYSKEYINNCIAFGKTAELISNYVHQGDVFCLEAHLHSGSYVDKDGNKRNSLDIVVDSFDFPPKQSKSSLESMGTVEDGPDIMF